MHLYKTSFGINTRIVLIFLTWPNFLMNSLIKKVLFLKTLWNFWKGGPQSNSIKVQRHPKGKQLFFDIDILHLCFNTLSKKNIYKKNFLVFLHKNQIKITEKTEKMSSGTFVDRIDPFAKRSLKKKQKKSQGSSRYRTGGDVELTALPLLKGKNSVLTNYLFLFILILGWITCSWHIFTNSESTNFFSRKMSSFLLKELQSVFK